MKLKLLLLVFFICTSKGYAQDSIVNYLDKEGLITTKYKARAVETIVKKDSIWLVRLYYSNGKIQRLGRYKHKDKTKPIGEFFEFYRNGQLKSSYFYNENSEKSKGVKQWFYNGALSATGFFKNCKKEGVWKYYHLNGKVASKLYFKNDSMVKSLIYDPYGTKVDDPLIKWKVATFNGGINKFISKIKKLRPHLSDYKIKGKVNVTFIVDIDGAIKDVSIENKLPKKLEHKIITFFEKINGWIPAVSMNRNYPMYYTIPLNFS